jgi:hypothetical protein
VKSNVNPIPFNQYGSNISQAAAFGDHSPGLKPLGGQATPIMLSEDDSPPVAPDVFKIHKMTPQDREEMGWESHQGWEFDNETIASRIAKLKKKRDGKVENPVSSPIPSQASPLVLQVATALPSTPTSGTNHSSRNLGAYAEPVLQKAMRAITLKNASGMSPSKDFVTSPLAFRFTFSQGSFG